MGRIALVAIVIGVVLMYKGFQEWRLSSAAKETPQKITCAELASKGPGDNAHVVLTDYVLGNNFVYKSESKTKSWKQVWIPAFPLDEQFLQQLLDSAGTGRAPTPPGSGVKVIIKSDDVNSESEMDSLQKDELQGMVVNKIDSLSGEEKKLLGESYAGFNADTCWIVEAGRTPSGKGTVFGWLGGGAAAILLGGVMGLTAVRKG